MSAQQIIRPWILKKTVYRFSMDLKSHFRYRGVNNILHSEVRRRHYKERCYEFGIQVALIRNQNMLNWFLIQKTSSLLKNILCIPKNIIFLLRLNQDICGFRCYIRIKELIAFSGAMNSIKLCLNPIWRFIIFADLIPV